MIRCYISCSLSGVNCNPQIDLRLYMSNFILHCECGTDTTYESMFKTEWRDGMYLECRICKAKYYPFIHVDIKEIKHG